MTVCKYTVRYGYEIAKFSDRSDAFTFARNAGYSEITDKTGLIGQFVEGKPTPEFAFLDKQALNETPDGRVIYPTAARNL
jgi:hypothetical protein